MLSLPLYEGRKPTRGAVELDPPRDRMQLPETGTHGRACDLCKLGTNPRLLNPCLGSIGDPGGLLVVGEAPGKTDAFLWTKLLRPIIEQTWTGSVAYDNAVKCFPAGKFKEKPIDECRGYLAKTLADVQPTRIIAAGAVAAYALLGRSVSPFSARGAYTWLRNVGGRRVPVFFLFDPRSAANSFVRTWLKRDLKHALTRPDPPFGPWHSEARIVRTVADALEAEAELSTHRWVAFDVESVHKLWNKDYRIISLSVCGDGDEEPYVWDAEALADEAVRAPLLRLLANKKVPKVGQNVKFDQLAVRASWGVTVQPIIGDTRLMRKILEPEADGKLAAMAEHIGMGGLKQEFDVVKSENTGKIKRRIRKQWHKKKPLALGPKEPLCPGLILPPYIDIPLRNALPEQLDDLVKSVEYGLATVEQITRYNARDSVATVRLMRWLENEIPTQPTIDEIWRSVVLPASIALERVEAWGVAASRANIDHFDRYLGAEEVRAKAVLDQYGADINWNSTDQVAELLFGKLRLKSVRKTGGGKDSTDAATLEALKDEHPLPAAILDYRWVTHLRGTYAQGLYEHVRADERIHPNIKLDGARSGRTSCTDPNLQNIPRAKDSLEGKMARDCFVAPPGFKLLELDYSQLELRVACMLSGDPVMREIFDEGVDYHLRTAQLVSEVAWRIHPDDVEDKHRSIAKSVNFGVLYGKSASALAKEWGVSKRKAQAIVDAIMGNFQVLQRWRKAREEEAERTGFVSTWWAGRPARKRPLWRIAGPDDGAAVTARNGATNSPIQGTASEFCVASLAQAVDWIEAEDLEDVVKLVLPVHDALLFQVRNDYVDYTACAVNEIMTSWDSMGLPLVVDAKVGPAWGSMVNYKIPSAKAA